MFPRFDVISQAVLHACLPRSRYVTIDRRLHLKWKRDGAWAGRKLADPFIDQWTIRFDRESRLIATKYRRTPACKYSWCNKIYFFFFSLRIENTFWDIKMRICCRDCSSIDASWRILFDISLVFFFLIDDAFIKYIRYEQELNGKWTSIATIIIWFYENLVWQATKLWTVLTVLYTYAN